jgi:hypothetical protein
MRPGTRLESPSQFTAEEHRERARQCLRLAQQTFDYADKALLLEMAQLWMRLARARSNVPAGTDRGSS